MAETKSTTPTKTTTAAKATPSVAAPSGQVEDNAKAGNVATDGDVISGAAVPGTDPEEHKAKLEEAASADRDDHVIGEGVFIDASTVGAGTILPDGTYGDPLPDPQVQRKNADPDYQVK